MRLATILASVALTTTPAFATGSGHPPRLPYAPMHYKAPPKGVPVHHMPNLNYGQNKNSNSNHNSNANHNKNNNYNANHNNNYNANYNNSYSKSSAAAAAQAAADARANASATGGNASATGGNASASNTSSNNADNSSSLTSTVRVEGHTYREARHRRIPVASAYAAPLTSGIDTCLGSASAGVQTPVVGISLGGTKRDRICETIKLSRELHHMGMREGAVQLLCIDERVRVAMRNAGTPCENVTYEEPMVEYDMPPPPPMIEYAPPPRHKPRRGERG